MSLRNRRRFSEKEELCVYCNGREIFYEVCK